VGKRDRRSGYTLIEVLLVLGIMGIIAAGAMALMVSSTSCFDTTTTEAFTDADAVIAMQMIVNDVREAKSISIIGGGTRLRVVFPKRTAEGYYDRHEADMTNQVDYYLSDSTGVPGQPGTWLWRGKDDGSRKLLKKDVWALEFEQDTSRSVKITVTARNESANGPKETELTQRVVYLRNY
jgi:prepilin-type N-terminal cleavage/methylation domain-containing protein